MLSEHECKSIAASIEADLESAFPGYVVKKVTVKPSQEYIVLADEKQSLPNFYHLYPQLTQVEADDQIVKDMEAIIQKHLPETKLVDFEQNAWNGPRRVEVEA